MLQIFRCFFWVDTLKLQQPLRLIEIFLLNFCLTGETGLYPILKN